MENITRYQVWFLNPWRKANAYGFGPMSPRYRCRKQAAKYLRNRKKEHPEWDYELRVISG